ncbi:hypothetical protein LSH36_4g09049 [Paralvinella palmiformis]|uniref:Out at first protein homolog n=1 Tax=Paralvinella palmiformis TaxID=53620 RepID=A0AAD9NIT9_9ANNE|nr:hypothetical protein LSH36_4g09049 [Paralvinella palmiformis]
MELQMFHLVILGEQELGQPQMQALCFLLRLNKNDFISSDAMSKLRQKNPSAVRHPEEIKGVEGYEMDLLVSYEHAYLFSPHVQAQCKDARDAIYIRDKDLKLLARSLSRDYTTLLGATKSLAIQRVTPCSNTTDLWRPCACHYDGCIMWYPCGLKYCKGKDSTGKTVNYRCGIKTCSKCRRFEYQARRRELCMWELPGLG